MRALVKTKKGKGFIEIEDVPIPHHSSNEVLIKVKVAGICGTDIHIWHDKMLYWPPVIMGHEFSGEIIKVGADVIGWKVGDRVVAEPHTRACGVCWLCRSGNIHICPHKRSIGWGIDGAFAEYIKMPSHLLHKIPGNVSYEEAALCEPAAIALNCVLLTSRVKPGDFVVVEGTGAVGLLAAMAARAAGAGKIMITGVEQDEKVRLKVARELGFETLNVERENIQEKVSILSKEKGADLVVEAAGVEASIDTAIKITRRMGDIAILGITGQKKVNILWDEAVFKVLNIRFCFSSTYESWERCLFLMSERIINTSPLITHTATLEEWEKLFSQLEKGNGIKGIFIF
ncbi:alcohol dehydrogenase catalytic domain-containing protein [Candidatus Aerophobetes bacterium]|nr:alcohol dehydrogenase catalytic domain-containing protein [Candidatus Aerophobetes bacterium]